MCQHYTYTTTILVGSGPPSLQNEFDNIQTVERSAETDTLKHINQATSPHSEPSSINPVMTSSVTGRSTTKNEKRSANTLYQELSFQDNEESEENEVTGEEFYFIEQLFINSFELCSLANQILRHAYILVFIFCI